MLIVGELPSVEELNNFIDSVAAYPVTAADLVQLAQAEGFGRGMADFYRSFPPNEQFINYDDLTSRSEQIQIMSSEENDQPWEVLRSPQE